MKNAVRPIRTTDASTTITTTACRNFRTKSVLKISLIRLTVKLVAAVAMVSLLSDEKRAPMS